MHGLPAEQIVLGTIQTTVLVCLIVRVWFTKLFRVYPYFFGYLLTALLQQLMLWFITPDQGGYSYVWLATEALVISFYTLIVLELYNEILGNLAGIANASRRYLTICLGIAILGSLLLLPLDKVPHDILVSFLIIRRAIVTSLVIFVLLMTAFLVYYPIPLNRNVIVYSIGYAIYFTVKAITLSLANIGHQWDRQVVTLTMAASTVSMMFWLALSRRGEKKKLVIGHRWNTEDQAKVQERLKAINSSFLRASDSTR